MLTCRNVVGEALIWGLGLGWEWNKFGTVSRVFLAAEVVVKELLVTLEEEH